MTDLKEMSVDKLENLVRDAALCCNHDFTFEQAMNAFGEMARRLREQEQTYAFLWKAVCEATDLLQDQGRPEGERLAKGIKAIIERAEQAESNLLACQGECAELREAAERLHHYWLLTKKSHIEHPQSDEWETAWTKLDAALSRSTGSKIMAVVRAAEKHAADLEHLEKRMVGVGIARPIAGLTASNRELLEAVRTLQEKP